jgi:hypothetical protein
MRASKRGRRVSCGPECASAAGRIGHRRFLHLFVLPIAHLAPSVLIDYSHPSLSSMGSLKVAISALDTVSIIFGMVPLVGENLKSAAELASSICEHVQVRRNSVSLSSNNS